MPFSRKLLSLFFSLAVLGGVLFISKDRLLVFGTKRYLKTACPKTLVYQSIEANKGVITLSGLQFFEERRQVTLEGVKLHFDLKKMVSSPALFFELAKVKVPKDLSEMTLFLSLIKRHGIDVEVGSGIFQLDETRYYFGFEIGKNATQIGSLFLFDDRKWTDRPFFQAQFELKGKEVALNCKAESADFARILSIAEFAFPQIELGKIEAVGTIDLGARAIVDQNGALAQLVSNVLLNESRISHRESQLSIDLNHLALDLSYPEGVKDAGLPLWGQLLCFGSLKEGNLLVEGIPFLRHLQGNCSLDPRQKPLVELSGELTHGQNPIIFSIEGTAPQEAMSAYSFDLTTTLDDQVGTVSETSLAISPIEEGGFVVELKGDHLKAEQIELAKSCLTPLFPRLEDWQIAQGTCSFEGAFFFEKGKLLSLQLQNFLADHITAYTKTQVAPFRFYRIEGEGRFVDWSKNPIGDLNLEITLPFSELLRKAPPSLQKAYDCYRSSDLIKLSSTCKWNGAQLETLAAINWPAIDQSVQFGFVSHHPFPASLEDIRDGWARSEKLDRFFYGPSLVLFSEDLEMYGKVDLLATYQESTFELALQVDDFMVRHPACDLQAKAIGEKAKTEGRAKLFYLPKENTWEGMVPIKEGRLYGKERGGVFENLDLELFVFSSPEETSFKGKVSSCELTRVELGHFKDVHFAFSVDDRLRVVENFEGTHTSSTGLDLTLQIPRLLLGKEVSSCELALLEGKETLAHCLVEKRDYWKGKLTLSDSLPLSGTFDLDYAYDPLFCILNLEARGDAVKWQNEEESFSIRLEKKGDELTLHHLALAETTSSGKIRMEEESFALSDFIIDQPSAKLALCGKALLDLPTKEKSLAIRSDLFGSLELKGPLPLSLEMKTPCKAAFSPERGWILSDLNLSGEMGDVHINQVEKLFTSSEGAIHKCCFQMTPALLASLLDARLLPTFAQDLELLQELKGELHFAYSPKAMSFVGTLGEMQVEGSIPVRSEEKALITLNDQLQLAFLKTPTEMILDSVEGQFGSIRANLHKNASNHLLGTLSCDLSQVAPLISSRLGDCLKTWKMGSGYTLEGDFTPRGRLSNWTFSGKLKGKDFQLGGHTFDWLDAKLEMGPNHISLENIDLTDKVAKVWIGEGDFRPSQNPSGSWTFHFPLVEIRSFVPYRLDQTLERKPSSYLVFKSATIQNLQGRGNDLMSLTGAGTLRFDTKGKSLPFKQLPSQMLSRLGVEPHLFSPMQGDVDYQIQQGRCYLQNLRNVFSAQKRLEFLMPKKPVTGYLDFAGNLFLDVEVKRRGINQNPLPLSIRGTWGMPQVNVQ